MKSVQDSMEQFPLLFVICSSLITLTHLDQEGDILPHDTVTGHKVSVQFGTVVHNKAGN